MTRAVTVVLDDDPTGTQEVHAVPVLLRRDRDALRDLLAVHDAVFVLTNTRATGEPEAVALVAGVCADVRSVEAELGVRALVVQRGDSTMRGHVFAEIDAAEPDDAGAVAVFAPAFPDGGRRTRGGVHEVRVDGAWVNAADTEFAADPVFGYTARTQVDYVRERGRGRRGVSVPVDGVREALSRAALREVVLPDVDDDADVELLAQQIRAAIDDGVRVVVRCAAPLAAFLAGAKSTARLTGSELAELAGLSGPAADGSGGAGRSGGTLVVVGSHTGLTGRQLRRLQQDPGVVTHELGTDDALADPVDAGRALADRAREGLAGGGVVVLATERERRPEHGTLAHGEAVMTALTTAVTALTRDPGAVGAVVAKGGITSAEVVRTGLGRTVAWVAGQVSAGVSVWVLGTQGLAPPGLLYGVVPGNIGDAGTLAHVVGLLAGGGSAPR